MTQTLSYSEIIKDRNEAENAIGKILLDLQKQTGCQVNGIALIKIIGAKDSIMLPKIDLKIFDN